LANTKRLKSQRARRTAAEVAETRDGGRAGRLSPNNYCAVLSALPTGLNGRGRPSPINLDGFYSLGVLQLGYYLGYGGDLVEIGEVGVAGQGVALSALYQNLYPRDAGDICGQRLDQRDHS